MRTVTLPSGESIPVLGQGTWRIGDTRVRRRDEIAALRRGFELGMTLVDTAEMYGEGRAEELVGEAISGRRNEVFLVSKVYPHNATRRGVVAACERSLRRLRTDHIDLYLLHWRGEVPLAETLAGFVRLVEAGKIRHYGVSNLDLKDMEELWAVPGGPEVATNQVLYNLGRRGIEWNLLPWCHEHKLSIMAYSPFDEGKLIRDDRLKAVAGRHRIAPGQVALAWLLRRDGVIAIPKSGSIEHVRENRAAHDVQLSAEDLADLDKAFPPPSGPAPLEIL